MGQRSATETLFGIITAFVERRMWTQAELARRLETRTETIRKRLGELQAGGFKLERFDDPPHVYWSVPKDWFPGALVFKRDEVRDLLRAIARTPRGPLRTKLLALVVGRLANVGQTNDAFDSEAVHPPEIDPDQERWLALVEDAATSEVSLNIRYFSASRRQDTWRHVSVHRVELGDHTHFLATCHRTGALRRFRLSNVSDARLDPREPFRHVSKEAIERFDRESVGRFHDGRTAVTCAFFVRDEEAAWVGRNLPTGTFATEVRDDGMVFRVQTGAVRVLARFVVGLGAAATPLTPELAANVRELARGALHGSNPKRRRRRPSAVPSRRIGTS